MSSSSNIAVLPEPRRLGRTLASCPPGRIVVVSERLPIVLTRLPHEEGTCWRAAPARGALISALSPVLRDRRGVWIGWPGVTVGEARRGRDPRPLRVRGGGGATRQRRAAGQSVQCRGDGADPVPGLAHEAGGARGPDGRPALRGADARRLLVVGFLPRSGAAGVSGRNVRPEKLSVTTSPGGLRSAGGGDG